LAAWWCRIPVFITGQRGIEDWKTKKEVFLEKVTSIFVDLYIGNSNACCDMLATRERISRKKLYTIPNGIAFDIPSDIAGKTASLSKQYQLPENKVIVGSVGRLQPVKGHHDFISAIPAVLRKCPDTYFIIVGEDHRGGELQRLAKNLGVEQSICFAGYRKDVAAWLNRFDIFVLPSLSEGMPVSVLEAMFMKKPVIATSVGGVPEVIENGEDGLLVPPKNPEELADAIVHMITDSALRESIAMKGYEKVQKQYRVDVMIKRYQDVFISLLKQKKRFNAG